MLEEYEEESAEEKEEETPKRRGEEGYEVPRDEKAFTKVLIDQIDARLESPEYKQHLKDIKKNRKYAKGTQNMVGTEGGEEETGVVRANLIHPELKKAMNECYAKNPEVSITPSENVGKDRYETWKQVGKTLELVINNQFSTGQADLKAKAKRAVRSADTTSFGWIKAIYQKHIETDPTVVARMDDVQDNIQIIDRLMKELEDDEGSQEELQSKEASREELQQQLKTLEESKEIVRAQGISLTVRPSECVIFSMEVTDTDDIQRADWITDLIWMKESKVKERFGFCPDKASKYNEMASDKGIESTASKEDQDLWIRVYEMWRRSDKQIYTMCDGYEGYLKDPYTPRKIGERFHGFFPLMFDPTDGSAFPYALVTQLRSLQDEHITTRSNFKEHRERSVPFNVAHGGLLDPNDVKNLTNPKFMETVVLKSAPEGMPLDQVFKAVQQNPIDPSVYSTDHISRDWEQVTRRGDASRGTVGISKTATEADILQSNLNVDTSERRDVVEDWFAQLTRYCLELILQEMSEEEVKKIAGEQAQWPQMSRNEVFDMVQLNVRVGSSGKPNASQEMERWLKMLPQFREALLAIVEMQEAGKDDQAEILTKLLRETIERFEERIDLDALLPKKDEEGQIDPEKQKAMQQQQAQMALQMKEMVSNIANTDADTMKKIAEAEAKEAGPQMQVYMTVLQGLLNNQNSQPGSVQQ